MPLALFNTLTRRVEPVVPLAPPRLTLYTCGPTVWNYAHLGNFRTFVMEDVLRRYLEYAGHEVVHVMNLTDVDDRTIGAAAGAGVSLDEHTARFITAFFEDRDWLRILPAHRYPRATQHVPQMIRLVERLLERGVAYRGEDGSVYFAIDRFPAYGRLARLAPQGLKAGVRVDADEYAKEDARDFVLWKAAKPEDERVGAAWDAPFGRGRPGWHLECSAMALDYLGETVDIHAGGVDLIFPHHEDEIAQSEAATGQPFVRCFVHGEFLLVEGTKMSKRYGNFLTVRDVREEGWDAAAVRWLFCSTHYRKQLNFSDEALRAAAAGASRLGEFRLRLSSAGERDASSRWEEMVASLASGFAARMDDDLDAPGALAHLMSFVRDGNRELDEHGGAGAWWRSRALEVFDRVSGVLGVLPASPRMRDVRVSEQPTAEEEPSGEVALEPPVEGQDVEAWAARLAGLRWRYRRRGEWEKADAVRRMLLAQGFEVRDTREGVKVVRKG